MALRRLAIDIGGTFTDVALDAGDGTVVSTKVLTTPERPEEAVLAGIDEALERRGLARDDVDLVLHGTTLATNALIERKGARTALIATEGFRDTLAIGYEDRYDQYDLSLVKAPPLIDRALRFTVPERVAADGTILKPLDEAAVEALASPLREAGIEAIAIAFLHAYRDGRHEARVRDILADALPDVAISLSSEVSPEPREYERTVTTVVNAYVTPLMDGYLARLQTRLTANGLTAPVLIMTSGGTLTTIETARRFPVRLIESGPAGGAILAAHVAARTSEDSVVGFDMGGTTAKICLIDGGVPGTSRTFEVDRQARFKKGSGLPLRIPVIDMIEIGAGGGSIASVDALSRIAVGPQSAGSTPGPAAYGRGGARPTVTDADLVLGRLHPDDFADGRLSLDEAAARQALATDVGEPLGLSADDAAYGVGEIVDETMANAIRVHAVENGADVAARTLIAFGGAAPVHAARLAEKLNMKRVIVPAHAGVGSAIGFLYAPVGFEVVRGRHAFLHTLDTDALSALFDEMREEANPIVAAASDAPLVETRTAYLRYVGQGHEIPVALANDGVDRASVKADFERAYRGLFGRTIDHAAIEMLSVSFAVRAEIERPDLVPWGGENEARPTPERTLRLDETETAVARTVRRASLAPGEPLAGPAVIAEAATATVVPPDFVVHVDPSGHLVLERAPAGRDDREGAR